jgi:prepilin-type N-terminal cleavage/methylation domain-containing protein
MMMKIIIHFKNRLKYSEKPSGNRNSAETRKKKREGFSLIETTISIALVGVALLGLAQLFTYSVMNNRRSDRMTNSTFLAQQQIDFLRNLPATDLNNLALSPVDEQVDVNNDGVQVFPASQLGVDVDVLIQNPTQYQIKADMSTVISR